VNNLKDALSLTAAEQSAIGLYCGTARVTLSTNHVLRVAELWRGAHPHLAPGTANPDRNPPRTMSRHVLNFGVGNDNLFHSERVRTIVRFTVLNLSNQASLYNFLAPFSGTHWIAPRTFQAQFGLSF